MLCSVTLDLFHFLICIPSFAALDGDQHDVGYQFAFYRPFDGEEDTQKELHLPMIHFNSRSTSQGTASQTSDHYEVRYRRDRPIAHRLHHQQVVSCQPSTADPEQIPRSQTPRPLLPGLYLACTLLKVGDATIHNSSAYSPAAWVYLWLQALSSHLRSNSHSLNLSMVLLLLRHIGLITYLPTYLRCMRLCTRTRYSQLLIDNSIKLTTHLFLLALYLISAVQRCTTSPLTTQAQLSPLLPSPITAKPSRLKPTHPRSAIQEHLIGPALSTNTSTAATSSVLYNPMCTSLTPDKLYQSRTTGPHYSQPKHTNGMDRLGEEGETKRWSGGGWVVVAREQG
ncbi:hypothetical protein BKA65DRAFT_33527 [Rhexocercosporidium sp. MPI-PUGE-AT-0058]|nr:hypothetical protein BKA65DRAFT_33527 [Rhexocercosporidium sp. MPI-PUGE-AT-0058]